MKRFGGMILFWGILAAGASLAWADFTAPAVNISNSALNSKYPKILHPPGTTIVMALWTETNGTDDYLYFSKSTDSGATWSAPVQLTSNGQILTQNDLIDDYAFSMCVDSPYVHVVMQWRYNSSEDYEILYLRSPDLGDTWPIYDWEALTINSSASMYPDVAAYGQYVHVTYQDDWPGNFDIMYKRIANYGDAAPDLTRRLTTSPSASYFPRIAVGNAGYCVSIVYQDMYTGNFNIFYKHIDNYGAGPFFTRQLTFSAADFNGRSDIATGMGSATYGAYVYIVYETNYPGNQEIMYKRLDNFGHNPSSIYAARLTYSATGSYSNSISYDPIYDNVHVSYQDNWPGNTEAIYRKLGSGGGGGFTGQRVSWGIGDSAHATVAASGQWAYVAWSDNTSGNYEIYVKFGN